jgi:hypothetical protein
MMRCDTFARSAVFGAVAAAACLPWALVASPLVGAWNAQALYLAGVTTVYVAGLATPRRQALTAAALAALAASVAVLAARSTTELAIALAAILGIARSGFLYRAAPARAAATEVALLAGGLWLARFLAGAWAPFTGLALWGFVLVQSLFFLVAGVQARRPVPELDPFEAAHRRAVALLERAGV